MLSSPVSELMCEGMDSRPVSSTGQALRGNDGMGDLRP